MNTVNTSTENNRIGIETLDGGAAPALKSVHVEGRLDGLLLDMRIRQHYRNESDANAEIVYTFPLAWGARLMGLDVIIGGKKLRGAVIAKEQARQRYEKAIDDGDAPVMVEDAGDGLFTANLGNIKPGEEIELDLCYAQLLRFEQGRLRFSVPTVIAPRYGDAHAEGGLQPHESANASIAADYPLTLKLDLAGDIAAAQISSPSHPIIVRDTGGRRIVTIATNAVLDRDFILALDGLAGCSFARVAPDNTAGKKAHTMLASFCPTVPRDNDAPLALKILVDCSGSMAGDSIRSAKEALHRILAGLDATDYVSLSRFGSSVEHAQTRLEPCEPATIRHLADVIQKTGANLGGTELSAALLSTFRDIAAPACARKNELPPLSPLPPLPPPAVLLITDGETWDAKNVINEARRSSHRVFVVGVGSAPAETVLRELAEKTGGACELVSPNEDIAAAIVRMFHRMRGAIATDVRVDWGADAKPLWQSAPPRAIHDGETVHLFAQFDTPPKHAPQLHWKTNGEPRKLRADSLSATGNADSANDTPAASLPRLAVAQKIAETATPGEKTELALRYQLVSERTNLFLIHVRATKDKTDSLPALHQVPQMLAAGWGGTGSAKVSRDRDAPRAAGPAYSPEPQMLRHSPVPAIRPAIHFSREIACSTGSCEILPDPVPATRKSWKAALQEKPGGLPGMLGLLDRLALQTTDFAKIVQELSNLPLTSQAASWDCVFILNDAARQISKETGADAVDVWAVLLAHVIGEIKLLLIHFTGKAKPRNAPARQTARLLRHRLKTIPMKTRLAIVALWEK